MWNGIGFLYPARNGTLLYLGVERTCLLFQGGLFNPRLRAPSFCALFDYLKSVQNLPPIHQATNMRCKALTFALLAQAVAAQQMIRFSCSQLVVARMDPLVNPGVAVSPHVHQIVGGNSFNVSMDPAGHDLVRDSTCTSCTFSEDFSNYWTAVLYFRARNGTYKRVRQFPNVGLRAE